MKVSNDNGKTLVPLLRLTANGTSGNKKSSLGKEEPRTNLIHPIFFYPIFYLTFANCPISCQNLLQYLTLILD